jgi:hypothetical protein
VALIDHQKGEIIEKIAPGALKTAKHVNYKGVLLTPAGKSEELENDLAMTLEEKLHGKGMTATNKTALNQNR